MNNFKPCPMCGKEIIFNIFEFINKPCQFFVTCENIKCSIQITGYAVNKDEAKQKALLIWNNRTLENKLEKHIADLESLITRIMIDQEFTQSDIAERLRELG